LLRALPTLPLLCLLLFSLAPLRPPSASAQAEYTYYGYVPSRIFFNYDIEGVFMRHAGRPAGAGTPSDGYMGIDPRSVRMYGLLVAVGCQDGTWVRVYALPEKSLVEEFTLNKMEKRLLKPGNGTFFKAVSNHPVTLILAGGRDVESGEKEINTFYTGVNGGYVDREFILYVFQGKTGLPFKVFTLEDSDVTVWDEEGGKVSSFTLKANQRQAVSLKAFHIYRVTSTGSLMIQSMDSDTTTYEYTHAGATFYPSAKGGFLGDLFYGSTDEHTVHNRPNATLRFIATSTADTEVAFVDLEGGRTVAEVKVSAGSPSVFFFNATYTGLAAVSKAPTMLMYKDDDLNDGGLSFTGLKAGQTAYLDVPQGGAYIFAYRDTVVTIDDVQFRLLEDSYQALPPGLHKVSSPENALVEVVNLDPRQGLHAFGECLPSVQSLSMTYEGLKVKSPTPEEAIPLTYIAAAAVAVAVVVLVALAVKRRR